MIHVCKLWLYQSTNSLFKRQKCTHQRQGVWMLISLLMIINKKSYRNQEKFYRNQHLDSKIIKIQQYINCQPNSFILGQCQCFYHKIYNLEISLHAWIQNIFSVGGGSKGYFSLPRGIWGIFSVILSPDPSPQPHPSRSVHALYVFSVIIQSQKVIHVHINLTTQLSS